MAETDDLRERRLEKLAHIRELGFDPYPPRCQRTTTAAALAAFASFEQAQQANPQAAALPPLARVGGRIITSRPMGRLTFAHLQDGTGRLQLLFRRDDLGEEKYDYYRKDFDLGDFIGAAGSLFRTRTGEITLAVQDFALLAKALRPLPEKWHGLVDVEKRYRQRYLDLVANEAARRVFTIRSQVISALRRFMEGRGFVEVETPILQPIYGGAAAQPFVTHYNVLDRDFFLRIATELYLKRLIVGGLEKVFEIGKNFRNEGISTKHNPEFTMMESYEAYADYMDVMRLVEEMFFSIASEVVGTAVVTFQGQQIDFTPPWRRFTLREAVREYSGVDIEDYPDQPSLLPRLREMGMKVAAETSWAKLVDELLSTYVEPKLIQPTFLLDYPVELSPLAKRKPDNPRVVERFEPFVGGLELGNAFSELNDPLDQRARFEEMARQREAGDEEAAPLDEDFLIALEHGMPPTGGLGIGVDRLVMLLADQASIREVILFPQLRTRE